MNKCIGLLGSLFLVPAMSFAQALNWENGRSNPGDVVACASATRECTWQGESETCTTVCLQYISAPNLMNIINLHSNRSAALESSVASVRQDLRPAIDAHTAELNSLKSNISSSELQRLIQKAVREELNQRGL